ncbi:hypothetical protein IAU60_004824 [Kwoniella sp. DSM 27419]
MEYISIIKDDVDLSTSHRYLRLPHPRTGQAQLYLPYSDPSGQQNVLEVVKVNGAHRRTWFVGDSGIDAGSILVHYPIDPLFLVIPLILALSSNEDRFRPLSDLLTDLPSMPTFALRPPFSGSAKVAAASSTTVYNADLGELVKMKCIRRVFKVCCEKKVVPALSPSERPQRYYRPSVPCALKLLRLKVDHFAREDEFEKFDHLVRSLGRDGLLEGEAQGELRRLARLKAACEHLSQWLPPTITSQLSASYHFAPLSEHLANRTAAAIAASQPPSNSSIKEAKGTKRKAPPTSKGVEALKKVNTNNMSKLTSFFKPKEGKESTVKKKK